MDSLIAFFNQEVFKALVMEDIGDPCEDFVTSDMSPQYAAKVSLKQSLMEKFISDEHQDASQRAIEKFLFYNDHCGAFVLEPKRLYDDLLINEVSSLLDKWLHPNGVPITMHQILRSGALGGGSSIGCDMNDLYTKLFNSSLSSYSDATHELHALASLGNPTWSQANKARESSFGNELVNASSLTTVRKKSEIRRTICSEPVLDMFYQRGIGIETDHCVRQNLGIDLSTQPDKNRLLAYLGSIDGNFCTIDSRSASDCTSLGLEPIFPRYYWRWLMKFRANAVVLPDGRIVKLNMVSSMGNGFTFSLETLVFSAIVCACYRLSGLRYNFRDILGDRRVIPNAGVFGDDIVVDRKVYDFVCHALQLFGYHVNEDKSFSSGCFRESCGEDYFKGVNIRGVYLKRMSTVTDFYSAINRLTSWSVRHDVNLDLTISYLLSLVPLRYVPFGESDFAGIKNDLAHGPDFFDLNRTPFYRCHVAVSDFWRVPIADKDRSVHKNRRFKYNPDGLLLSLINGTIREGRVGIRSEDDLPIRTKVLQRRSPNWDYLPSADAVKQYRLPGWQTRVAECFDRCIRCEVK